MKKTDRTDIKTMDTKTLMAKVKKTKEEIGDLTLDKNMAKLKDLKSISKKKYELALVMTVLTQKMTIEALELKANEKVQEKGTK